jgi:ketosteroid isomerase-like protein
MKKVFHLLVCSALFFACNDPKTAEKKEATAETPATSSKGYEFADDKFVEIGKKATASLESGDVDGWAANYADNAVYHWNNFDSLVGKAAITDYWKKRRADVIDSMSFTKQIWLPVKVNTPLTEGQMTGNYALYWFVSNTKYRTGKSMKQRIHMVFHFNDSDKIDRVSQYLDRVPINEAMKK